MYPFSSPFFVGLDIQPHGLRLITLRKTHNRFLAMLAIARALPREVFVDGKIREWEMVGLVLSEVVEKMKLSGMATAIQMPVNLVRMQKMQVPLGMPEDVIEKEIKVQLERDFPGLSDSLAIDYSVDPLQVSGYSQVSFVVTREEYVSQYVSCINATGLKVKAVDVDLYALMRAFSPAVAVLYQPEDVNAIVCDMHDLTLCIIFSAHEIFIHDQWMTTTESEFLSQLHNRFSQFSVAFPAKSIRNLVIYSQHKGMDEWVKENNKQFEFNMQYFNPFSSITLSRRFSQQIQPEKLSDFLIACGLAMREIPRW